MRPNLWQACTDGSCGQVLSLHQLRPRQWRADGPAGAAARDGKCGRDARLPEFLASTLGAPVVAAIRLRGGSAASSPGRRVVCHRSGSHRPCHRLHRHTRGADGLGLLQRGAVRAAGAFFSVTVPLNPHVAAAIAGIPADAWTPIQYPRALWDDQLRAWVSDAAVAEVPYTAFTSKKGGAVTARLIVRRVKDLNRQTAAGQDELFDVWRYHAVFTDSPFAMLQAEAQHRDHAIVEQVLADWTSGPLAHLPSGSFPANAAWLTLAAISHNLLRAAGALASLACAKARGATLSRDLIDVAARTARHGRGHITLHLPDSWHRQTEWMNLFQAATSPPAHAA
jgi:hypothetical protein